MLCTFYATYFVKTHIWNERNSQTSMKHDTKCVKMCGYNIFSKSLLFNLHFFCHNLSPYFMNYRIKFVLSNNIINMNRSYTGTSFPSFYIDCTESKIELKHKMLVSYSKWKPENSFSFQIMEENIRKSKLMLSQMFNTRLNKLTRHNIWVSCQWEKVAFFLSLFVCLFIYVCVRSLVSTYAI